MDGSKEARKERVVCEAGVQSLLVILHWSCFGIGNVITFSMNTLAFYLQYFFVVSGDADGICEVKP